MWNMHNWDSATTDAYHLTAVARTAAFCHNDDLYRCLNRRHRKRYVANMPCVCGNGRIIRCAEGNRVSRNVQKTILHMVFIGIVYELVEAFTGGLHVHACQSHSIPRLIAEKPFVDPPAVDGRQAIDDVSTDCEFRITGQFRETNRGYGMLLQCHPAAVRRGVGGFRVAKHLHLPVTLDKQAETAGRERYDAHVGERTERFWDGLIRRRVVLLSTAGELDVAVDRDDASDATQSEAVVRIRRLPLLGYGKLLLRVEDVDGNSNAIAQLCTACVPCDNLESFCRMTVRDHRDVVERWDFVLIVVHQLQFDGV